MQGMNRKIGIGVLWNLGGLFISRGASMVFTLFLARFLAPQAFGLIAMMMVFFELASVLVESGMGQALIRSKEVSVSDLNTVFYANMCFSLLAYLMLYLGSPYVAGFYQQPELVLLVQITGFVVFFNALKVVQTAVLTRAMNFKMQMKANTLSAVGSGVIAVVAAYLGAGVWSLVAQLLSAAVISALFLWAASVWRPSLKFSRESFKRLFGFGLHLLIEGFLTVLFQNSYVLVIGRVFSAEITGLYFFARKISQLVSEQLTGAVQQATFPALATLQDNDEVLRHKYRRLIQLLMFIVAPIVLFLAAVAEPLFAILFDEKWKGAVLYLQLLSVMAVLFPLHAMNINLLNVKGRSDLVLRVGIIKKSVGLLMLLISIPFGVAGIIIGQVISSVLALIPNTYYSAKLINYGLKEQLLDAFKPVLVAFISAALSWWLATAITLHLLTNILTGLVSGSLVYLVGCWLIKAEGFVWIVGKSRLYLSRT